MNKHVLQSEIKSSGTAYLCWFLAGCHYAYFGKWGLQILYWITLGGVGIWALVDLFTLGGRVNKHNAQIASQIEAIENREKDDAHARNLAMIQASKS